MDDASFSKYVWRHIRQNIIRLLTQRRLTDISYKTVLTLTKQEKILEESSFQLGPQLLQRDSVTK